VIDARLMPEHILEGAQQLFQDQRYWEAIQQLEPMIPRAEGPTRARAMMLLSLAYMKNPLWKRRAEGVLLRLMEENPRDVAAHFLLAEIYRSNKLLSRARSMYRKILEIEPGHAEARRALDFLERKEGPAALSGVLTAFRRR
jgi:cytochrome c-type biogenesis protein CcmH/NrfG